MLLTYLVPGRSKKPLLRFLTGLTLIAVNPVCAEINLLPRIDSRATDNLSQRPADLPEDETLEASKIRVGSIRIQPENIFATESNLDDTLLFRLGNLLHIPTQENTIREQLLFNEGDLYNARLLQENERLLRSRSYLGNAIIEPVEKTGNLLDLEVRTQDVWSLKPGISFSRSGGENTGGFELEELNLLGSGNYLRLSLISGVDRDTRNIAYRDTNIAGSWWQLGGSYYDNSDGDAAALSLKYPFKSLDAKTSSGVSAKHNDRISSQYDLGEVTTQYRSETSSNSAFYGWSEGLEKGWSTRYRAGFTHEEKLFEATSNTRFPLPQDRELNYPWISIEHRQDAWQTTSNRNQIRKVEDFTLGWRFTGLLGYAHPDFGADQDSLITKLTLRKGLQVGGNKHLQMKLSSNGRYESSQWNDLISGGSVKFFWHQSARRTFYAGAGASVSKNLDTESQLLLGGDNGLRGYPLRYQSGEGRWLVTLEQRFFTDWYPFRLFHVGGAIFADVGRSTGQTEYDSESLGVLRDVGLGLRLGNSRSGLGNVIHLDVAVPLDGTDDIDDVQFLVQTKSSF